MSEQAERPVSWSPDIDYDTIWFVVGQITNQIAGRGIQILQQKLEEEGLDVTGKLKGSLMRDVRQNNSAWLTELAMQFEAYGRFKDMKELHYSNKGPSKEMIESIRTWVDRALDGKVRKARPFQFVSGWKPHGAFPKDRKTTVHQLTWAIARSRFLRPIRVREGKGWYIRNYMREIYGQIEDNIQAAAAQAALNTVAKALKDATNA